MKKLSLCIKNYALCIIMSLSMVSCGGDNGGDDNNGGSGEEQPQEIAGYRYVDLGLPSGLKWATSAKTYQADAFIAKNSNGVSVEIKGVTGRYLGRQIRAVSE